MKVALVVTNLSGGGAELGMLRLASALDARGHSVYVFLLDGKVSHAIPGGVRVVPLAGHGERTTKGWIGRWLAARRLVRARKSFGLGPDWLTVSTLPFADEAVARAQLPNAWSRISNTLSAEIAQLQAGNPGKARRRLARYRT